MNRTEKIKKMLAIFRGMADAASEDIGDIDFLFLIIDHSVETRFHMIASSCVVCASEQLQAIIESENIQHIGDGG